MVPSFRSWGRQRWGSKQNRGQRMLLNSDFAAEQRAWLAWFSAANHTCRMGFFILSTIEESNVSISLIYKE